MSKAVQPVAAGRKNADLIYFVLAAVVLVAGFYFVPKIIGLVPVSFLAEGAGLNKLLSVLVVAAGVVAAMLPSNFAKYALDLFKGARVEMRKITWSKRDMVVRTTIMVLFMVVLATFFIFLVDTLLYFFIRLFV